MKAIKVDSLSKVIGERVILNNISFSVYHGEIHGLLGPNGAGKTTTMRIICSLLHSSSGNVEILGSEGSTPSIGFLIEDAPLYKDMYVKEYLIFVGKLRKIKKGLDERVNTILEDLDLVDVQDRLINNLSKGFKQRVGIAQAIIHDPDIVVLDEPTLGLDPKSMVELRDYILKLKEKHTILISSHLLHEMSLICDRVTIINNGKVLSSGTVDDLAFKIHKTKQVCVSFKEKIDKSKMMSDISYVNSIENHAEENHSYFLQIEDFEMNRDKLIFDLIKSDYQIISCYDQKSSLENIFMEMTK